MWSCVRHLVDFNVFIGMPAKVESMDDVRIIPALCMVENRDDGTQPIFESMHVAGVI